MCVVACAISRSKRKYYANGKHVHSISSELIFQCNGGHASCRGRHRRRRSPPAPTENTMNTISGVGQRITPVNCKTRSERSAADKNENGANRAKNENKQKLSTVCSLSTHNHQQSACVVVSDRLDGNVSAGELLAGVCAISAMWLWLSELIGEVTISVAKLKYTKNMFRIKSFAAWRIANRVN